MRKLTDVEKELRKMARRLKKHCEETYCKDCCFKKGKNVYDYCQIGYGNNGFVPRGWEIK